MPAVSVVIPAFNSEAFIGDALASIAAQTLTDVEVLVVDDGSTDGTIREAERWAGKLDLTVVRQANAGPSAARNNGIRRARAARCALLDADDLMLPDLLAAQVAALDANPSVGLVVTDVETFDDRGTLLPARWRFEADDDPLERLVMENYVTTSAVMAPTACFIDAGLFPEDRRVAEDYELWLRMAVRWRVALIDRPLVRYRYTSGSLSADRLFSAECALDVIQTFWRQHTEYRAAHPQLAHRSLARHLTNTGAAAAIQGRRRIAVSYLLRALGHDAKAIATWKCLAKTLALPAAYGRRMPAGG